MSPQEKQLREAIRAQVRQILEVGDGHYALDYEDHINEALSAKQFAKAVKDEFDVETLQLMQSVIQKQIDLVQKMSDMANPRKTVKGFRKEGLTNEASMSIGPNLYKVSGIIAKLTHKVDASVRKPLIQAYKAVELAIKTNDKVEKAAYKAKNKKR